TAFWREHLRPEKLVAIDLMNRDDSGYFRDYVARNELSESVRTYWRTDQGDRANLRRIVAEDLGGALDLVIDDGSHLYQPTKASFETLFPLLPPGGMYIIEDWAWEHWAEFQDPMHQWGNEEGLGRLVREIIEATGSSKTLIRSVHVFEGFAAVERGEEVVPELRLDDRIVRRPWRARTDPAVDSGEVKAIAFYLPQFHAIPENDRWWGKGYTEWSRVARARPLFEGHYQPHLPERLGYYDLRLAETRERQAELARAHGIHGFCYHYYWFAGKRLLERPLDEVLASGAPDFPFCVCWANESWTRRWDGSEKRVLMQQAYSPELDRTFLEDLVPLLSDPRYIRVDGKPMLIVYRASDLPEPWATTRRWREVARVHGIPDLHLVAARTLSLGDPRPLGFDAAVEFPPHGRDLFDMRVSKPGIDPKFEGNFAEYKTVVERRIADPAVPYRLYRTAMPGWDNTARLGMRATLFHGATPELYETWMRALVEQARLTDRAHRYVFVNGWNEWAEGAHLEPDQKFGMGWLEATARALR
ncbi:MAG TPA: glycoside hydrolase family 99-like domain-containing protein, partial [Thermoanaerobaculia bacterium]|nr:glycoside hydrolase family 99-like domain-containing protein [Thermoanaerobaculia bacterium]